MKAIAIALDADIDLCKDMRALHMTLLIFFRG